MTPEARAGLRASLEAFGTLEPIVWNERTGNVVGGHQRLTEYLDAGLVDADFVVCDLSPDDEKAANLALNNAAIAGEYDVDRARVILDELETTRTGLFSALRLDTLRSTLVADVLARRRLTEARAGALAERFIVPPFSTLDARQGYWQDRRRAWLALGIESELGRGEGLTFAPTDVMRAATTAGQTSTFDPVLCELAYRWFAPPRGRVLDPFAGGSVRGVVAGLLGMKYVGVDLSLRQCEANYANWEAILADLRRDNPADKASPEIPPRWICGDSLELEVGGFLGADEDLRETFDFVFSCPPYGDLEQYSKNPADLSTMSPDRFAEVYRDIIVAAVARLRPDRFAVFVVGSYRVGGTFYRDLSGETVRAFQAAGAGYYNDAVLLNAISSASVRATRYMVGGRKLAKVHQNVLVFCKGDPKRATEAVGGPHFEVGDPPAVDE